MKKSISILFVLIGFSISQTFQVGIEGGSTMVLGQAYYVNELETTYSQENLGNNYLIFNENGLNFGSEYNLGIKLRFFFEELPFNIVSIISYNSIVGDGAIKLVPHPASSYAPPPSDASAKLKLYNLSIGTEYYISRCGINPYISGSIMLNYFDDIFVAPEENYYSTYEYTAFNGGVRYGFAFGIGIDYDIKNNFSIGISTKYSMNNLFGRESSEKILNTLRTNINFSYNFWRGL
jgi:outer membrane protein W